MNKKTVLIVSLLLLSIKFKFNTALCLSKKCIIIKGLALQTQKRAVYKVCPAEYGVLTKGGGFYVVDLNHWFLSDGLCMGFCWFSF